MRRWFGLTITLLLVGLVGPLDAQQWQVAREQFAFGGRQLTVHVEADAEGTLQVIRGPHGIVRVSGRSADGMTAAGLTGRRDLTLTAAGAGPVDYVITVPERVRVSVHLPDRHEIEAMGGHHRTRTFNWGPRPEPVAHQTAWVPPPETVLHNAAAYTVFTADLAPRTVALPDLTNVRTITVQVEGTRFRVGASRPLALYPGDTEHLEIRPAGPPMEIILVIPAGTHDFRLDAGDDRALTVRGTDISVHCSPSTRQWLSAGRGWVTFTPIDHALDCNRSQH